MPHPDSTTRQRNGSRAAEGGAALGSLCECVIAKSMRWLLSALACKPPCGGAALERNADIYWSFGYVGHMPEYDFFGPVDRADLLCALDDPDRFMAAHLRLVRGSVEIRDPVQGKDGFSYYDWHGLVMVDRQQPKGMAPTLVPDPRSQACLARRWREEPPSPERCWEEILKEVRP